MTYEEYIESLKEPDFDNTVWDSMIRNNFRYTYKLIMKLEDQDYKISKLEDELYQLKKFIERNVEPDLRYMG